MKFRYTVGTLLIALAVGSPARSSSNLIQNTSLNIVESPTPNWVRYAPGCDPGGDEDLLSCGSLGKYKLQPAAPIPGCTPVASGVAVLDPYPRRIVSGGSSFPGTWWIAVEQALATLDSESSSATGGSGATGSGSAGYTEIGSSGTDAGDWIAIVDFDDEHGWSTSYLAALLAGPGLSTELIPLDAGESDPLGETINDFHVVRALCSIVDRIENGQDVPPTAVNMSFGRLKAAGEAWFGSQCRSGKFGCQVAQVIGELKQGGVNFFGAAGNHGELLFPAGLPDVLTVGMLDLNSLPGGDAPVGVWENPPGVEALAPGGHLCLDYDWAAPAGTSYSSALLAGWFAGVSGSIPSSGEGAPWAPVWNDELACYVLSNGTEQVGACNAAATAIFASLDGTDPNPCWEAGLGQPIEIATPGSGPTPLDVPSFDHWAAQIHPTPSGDPCVPCVGLSHIEFPLVPILDIDLSHSPGLDPEVYISNVFLKTVTGFEYVPLTPNELEALRSGTMEQMSLIGYELGAPGGPEPSLWFELSDEPNPNCGQGSECFWTASDILIRSWL